MDLLADVVRNPAFAAEEIDRQKQQAVSSLQVSANDPDYIASSVFDRLVYGFHPYGLPGSGTPETLAGITREDLQAFHKALLRPQQHDPGRGRRHDAGRSDRAGAAGVRRAGRAPTLTLPQADRAAAADAAHRRRGQARRRADRDPRRPAGDPAQASRTTWRGTWRCKILGGEGANRLHRVLRSERGLTYGASAETQAMKQAGDYMAETDTRTETTGEALRLTVDEFAKI